MKKTNFLIILMAMFLLSACARKTPAETKAPETTAAVTAAVTTTATTAATTEAKTEAVTETAAETVKETETAAPETSGAAVETVEEEKEHINTSYGYFVKYGDKVYYRHPGADSMRETAIFGDFLSQILGSSKIYSYDTGTGEIKAENNSLGYGPMAVCDGSLYISEYEYPNDIEVAYFASLNLESGEYVDECANRLLGSDKEGKWVISYGNAYRNETVVHCINYSDGSSIESIESESGLVYVGAADNFLIYEECRNDSTVLWRCNMETGELLRLGKVPTFEEYEIPYAGDPEGFAYEDGKLAIVYSAYEGTGHFLAGSLLITANVNKLDSIEWTSANYSSDYYYDEMSRGPGVAFIEGKAALTDGMPYDVEIDYRTGNMILFDENGKATVVGSGYDFFESEEEGTTVDIEVAEYVDGMIYAVRNEMWRAPEDDIGWRYAYERKFTYILEIDPKTGEETIIDSVENSVN